MSTFFVQNPTIERKYHAVGIRSRTVYEFGDLPVRVDDPMDIEKFRGERVDGRPRLIETNGQGQPLEFVNLHGVNDAVPQSHNVYRPSGELPSASQNAQPLAPVPMEAKLTRESGVLPPGMSKPVPIVQPPSDDDDLGEQALIQRRKARGHAVR